MGQREGSPQVGPALESHPKFSPAPLHLAGIVPVQRQQAAAHGPRRAVDGHHAVAPAP